MENNTGFDERQTDAFGEVVELGFNSSAEILSKLLNNQAELAVTQLNQEKIMGLESFGDQPGVAVGVTISGAIQGTAAVVIQNQYVKEIINILMSIDDGDEQPSGELDDIAVGTFKELIGQLAASFGESLTNFLGAEVKIESGDASMLSADHGEVAAFIGCTPDEEAYSLMSSYTVGDISKGEFFIIINEDTVINTLSKIISPEEEGSEEYDSNYGGGMDMPNFGGAVAAAKQNITHATMVGKNGGINVQSASFPSFAGAPNGSNIPLLNGNMDLLMDVPLNVTIEIGKTRKKMREIMEFAQGTIIDLEKQAGAPVDVVVNGQLIARGDVVVIDDNFGVRITEIIGNNAFSDN